VQSGVLNAALVYQPAGVASMQVEEKLIQIRTSHRPGPYVYVDCGPEFRRQRDILLPEYAKSSLYFNLGPLALQYIPQFGGSDISGPELSTLILTAACLNGLKNRLNFRIPFTSDIRDRRVDPACKRR
jgi:hypothetical protein